MSDSKNVGTESKTHPIECHWCGKKNPDDAAFCTKCGSFLKDLTVAGLKKAGAAQTEFTIQELREAVNSQESHRRQLCINGLNSIEAGDLYVELNTVEYHKAGETYYILPLADYEDMLRQMAEDDTCETYDFIGNEDDEDCDELGVVKYIPYLILEDFVCLGIYPDRYELPRDCFGL